MTGPNAGDPKQPTRLGGVDDNSLPPFGEIVQGFEPAKQLLKVNLEKLGHDGVVGEGSGDDDQKTVDSTGDKQLTVTSKTPRSDAGVGDQNDKVSGDDEKASVNGTTRSSQESQRTKEGGGSDSGDDSSTPGPGTPREGPEMQFSTRKGGADRGGGGGGESNTYVEIKIDSSNLHHEIAFGEEGKDDNGNIKKRVTIFDASDPAKVVYEIDEELKKKLTEELKKKLTEELNKLKEEEATKKPKDSGAKNEEGDNLELKSSNTAPSSAHTTQASDSAGDEIPIVKQSHDEQQPKKVDEVDEQGPLVVTRTDCAYLKNDKSKLGFTLTEKQKEMIKSDPNPNNLKVLNTISKLTYDDSSKKYTNHTFYLDKKGMEQYELIHAEIVKEIDSGELTKDKISKAFERAIEEMQNTDSSIQDSTKKLATGKNKPTLGEDKLDNQDIEDINKIILNGSTSNQRAIQIMEILIVGEYLKISSAEVIRKVDEGGKRKDDKAEIKISCGYEGTVNLARKKGGKVDRFFIDQTKDGVEKFEYLGIFKSDLQTHHSDYHQKNWDYKKCKYTFKEDDVVKKFERESHKVFRESLNTFFGSSYTALIVGCIGLFNSIKMNKSKNQKPKRSTSSRFTKNPPTKDPRGNQQAPNAHGGDDNSGNAGGVFGRGQSGDGKGGFGLRKMKTAANMRGEMTSGAFEIPVGARTQRSKARDQGGAEGSPRQEAGAQLGERGESSAPLSPRTNPVGPDGTKAGGDLSQSSSESRS